MADFFGTIGHIGFSAMGGVIFVYLIRLISSHYLYIKGIFFGLAIWFFAYTTTYMLKVPHLQNISFETSVADYFSSSVYGFVLTYVLLKLTKKTTMISRWEKFCMWMKKSLSLLKLCSSDYLRAPTFWFAAFCPVYWDNLWGNSWNI